MDNETRRELIDKSPIAFQSLRKWNISAGFLHLIQGIILIGLGLWLEWTRAYTLFTLNSQLFL